MNEWLLRRPLWQLGLLCGGVLTVVITLLFHFGRHAPWPEALIAGVGSGILCGFIVALLVQGQFARTRQLYDSAESAEARRVLARGALRGPVPTDPEARAALARQVDEHLESMQRRRITGPVLSVALGLGAGWMALERSPWWWVAVGFFAVSAAVPSVTVRKLEKRAELLRRASAGE